MPVLNVTESRILYTSYQFEVKTTHKRGLAALESLEAKGLIKRLPDDDPYTGDILLWEEDTRGKWSFVAGYAPTEAGEALIRLARSSEDKSPDDTVIGYR